MLITLFALSIPYLTKIAIDRYIVASWYPVDSDKLKDPVFHDLKNRYSHLLETNNDHSVYYISNINIKKIDPSDLHRLRARGLLSSERFYRVGRDVKIEKFLENDGNTFDKMTDGSFLIPYSLLERLPEKTILKNQGRRRTRRSPDRCHFFSFCSSYHWGSATWNTISLN